MYNFLPQDYESPKLASSYAKLEDGENRFRILSAPIVGWEDWIDKRPVRYRFKDKPVCSHDPTKPIKYFWSVVVWNYSLKQIQILHITQVTVWRALETLAQDIEWGSPFCYDIKIHRAKQGDLTKYTVTPVAPKPVAGEVIVAFHAKPCNLDALFSGGDPWANSSVTTPLADAPDREPSKVISGKIVATQTDMFPTLDKLKAELEQDSIPWDRLEEWISMRCRMKSQTGEAVIAACLDEKALPGFKKAFAAWIGADKKAASF